MRVKPAVILIGHGSKKKGFDRPMKSVAAALKRAGHKPVVCAYLEITPPNVLEAVRALSSRAENIVLVPYFLLPGMHVLEDIPQLAKLAKRQNPHVRIKVSPYLGFHEKIVGAVKDRIREAR